MMSFHPVPYVAPLAAMFTLLGPDIGYVSAEKPLHGKVLRILPVETAPSLVVQRNASGHLVGLTGIGAKILTWLSDSLGFDYSIIDVDYLSNITFDDSIYGPGWKHYTINNTADMVIGTLVLAASRLYALDFAYPVGYGYFELLIPAPKLLANVGAPWKPFSPSVWIASLVSILAIIISLYLVNKIGPGYRFSWVVDYVIHVLLVQGGYCQGKKLSIRQLAGVWCLVAFFLVNFYNSVLISFISAPNRQPVIERLADMPLKPHLKVVTNRGWPAEDILLAAKSGVYKYLGDMLRSDPSLRCPSIQYCVDKVLLGNFVYIWIPVGNAVIMEEDLRTTGQCHFSVPKDKFMPQLVGFAYPKESPYRRLIDPKMVQFWETGLHDVWEIRVGDTLAKCNRLMQMPKKVRLGLSHLSSAFIVLLIGLGLSFVALLLELLLGKLGRRENEIIVG